jgi:hypothetical protein
MEGISLKSTRRFAKLWLSFMREPEHPITSRP